MLEKDTKIFVAGHNGLVGSAIWNNLKQPSWGVATANWICWTLLP